jgi:hypothetical protein
VPGRPPVPGGGVVHDGRWGTAAPMLSTGPRQEPLRPVACSLAASPKGLQTNALFAQSASQLQSSKQSPGSPGVSVELPKQVAPNGGSALALFPHPTPLGARTQRAVQDPYFASAAS